MIITCPACATQFRVPDGALGSNGRKLRCSSCRHVWFQEPIAPPLETQADPPVAPTPEAAEPAAPEETNAPPPPADQEAETGEQDDAGPSPAAPDSESSSVDEAFATYEPPVPPEVEEPTAATVAGASFSPEESLADRLPTEEAPEEEHDGPQEVAPADTVAEEPGEPTPSNPQAVAPTSREPGAVMPRATKPEASQTSRSGLRLVGKDTTGGPAAAPENTPAAGPSFDVTRVVTPDSAPEEKAAPPRKRRSGLILVVLLLVAVVAGAYFERIQVMRFLPQTASLYALVGLVGAPSAQGLQLLDVAFRVEDIGGTPSLIVSGKVMNVGRDYRLIPELRVVLLDAAGDATESWALRTTAEGLAPGATTVFEAAYPDPPRTGEDTTLGLVFSDLI